MAGLGYDHELNGKIILQLSASIGDPAGFKGAISTKCANAAQQQHLQCSNGMEARFTFGLDRWYPLVREC